MRSLPILLASAIGAPIALRCRNTRPGFGDVTRPAFHGSLRTHCWREMDSNFRFLRGPEPEHYVRHASHTIGRTRPDFEALEPIGDFRRARRMAARNRPLAL